MSAVRIREELDADREAVGALAASSVDGGAVSFRTTPLVSPEAAAEPGRTSVRLVAERPGSGIVGAASVTVGRFRYRDADRPFALLSGLVVHPAHRREGIGGALARERLARGEEIGGAGVVFLADIQRGNAPSLAAARRWATAWTGPAIALPVRMARRAPTSSLELREARAEDLAAEAVGWARSADGREFARVRTELQLREWLAATPFADPVNRCFVALDNGTVVAGMTVRETGRLRTMTVTRMPAHIRVANIALHVVPRDGVLRNVEVDHLWFAPGRVDAGRALWEHARWTLRESGTTLVINLDERDPVRRAVGQRPWTPSTSFVTAVRADEPPRADRLFQPLG